jgi:type VI secretion system protein ImpA
MIPINIENILKPISKKNPCGRDLRKNIGADSLYYKIKDLRNASRELERQQSMGFESTGDQKPSWDKLLILCFEVLENQSKDLEILVWMIEALVRESGFSGFQQGFNIASQLMEHYWDFLYPLPEGEGMEIRVTILNSLNGENYEGTLIRPIYHLAITEGTSMRPFALWQYQQAIENSKIQDKALIEKRRSQGSIFLNDIYGGLKESRSVFYENLIRQISEARAALETFYQTLVIKSGLDSFLSAQIINVLDVFNEHITYLLKEAPFKVQALSQKKDLGSAAAVEEATSLLLQAQPCQSVNSVGALNKIQNREEALRLLSEVADFFRYAEPQSPLPYLLQRSIHLGRLSFPDLLKALVNEEGARRFTYDLLGIEN